MFIEMKELTQNTFEAINLCSKIFSFQTQASALIIIIIALRREEEEERHKNEKACLLIEIEAIRNRFIMFQKRRRRRI